jgi:hypothetical protein
MAGRGQVKRIVGILICVTDHLNPYILELPGKKINIIAKGVFGANHG